MRLSVGIGPYDRTQPLFDGRVTIPGIELDFVDAPLEKLFSRALSDAAYHIAELSFSNFVRQCARGEERYVGLPIFLSRSFRHSAIYVRRGSDITSARDLVGRRVGLREYTNTAALVVRGMLKDEYGVDPATIRWFVGDIDRVEREEVQTPEIDGVDVTAVTGTDLSTMLAAGELDAVIAYSRPRCADSGHARRLFEDYARVEEDYFRRTHMFPIMHLVGLRRDIYEDSPGLAAHVAAAFLESKQIAVTGLFEQQALKVSLPWAVAEAERTAKIFGRSLWSYGLDANRHVISRQLAYSWEQGLTPVCLQPEDVFCADEDVSESLAVEAPGEEGQK